MSHLFQVNSSCQRCSDKSHLIQDLSNSYMSLGFFQDFIGVPDDLWGLVRPIQVLGQEMGQCCLWSGELWSKSGIFINLEDVLQTSYRCLTFGSRSERRIQSTEFAFYNSALLRPSTTNITMWKEKAIQPWWLGGRAVVYKQSYRISLSRWINPSLGRAWLYGTNGLALLCTSWLCVIFM